MSNLKDHIVEKFNKTIINVNGHEYVSVNVFQSAVSEVAVLESLLGSLALRLNEDIVISEDEAIEYMCKNNENVDIKFDNKNYIIKVKSVK